MWKSVYFAVLFMMTSLIVRVYPEDRLAIIYLVAKQHNSYNRPGSKDSLRRTSHGLQLLYENVLGWTKADVLLFHTGDYDSNDLQVTRMSNSTCRLGCNLLCMVMISYK